MKALSNISMDISSTKFPLTIAMMIVGISNASYMDYNISNNIAMVDIADKKLYRSTNENRDSSVYLDYGLNNDSTVSIISFDPLQEIQGDEYIKQRLRKSVILCSQVNTIRMQIAKYFNDAVLELTYLMDDGENEGEYALTIYTTKGYREARTCLNTFDNDWWLDYRAATGAPIIVDVSFL